MNYYAVIDKNVIVSALLKEGSIPWQILDLVIEEKIIPVFNKEIIAEYEEVLIRNKFCFSPAKIKVQITFNYQHLYLTSNQRDTKYKQQMNKNFLFS